MQSQMSVLGYLANSDHKFIKRTIPLCQTNQSLSLVSQRALNHLESIRGDSLRLNSHIRKDSCCVNVFAGGDYKKHIILHSLAVNANNECIRKVEFDQVDNKDNRKTSTA